MSNENVTIERVVAGGDGMARLADGRVVFIGGTITGERVNVEITTNKKDFARGNVVEILDASPHRVAPPCKFVSAGCGGCSWQHLAVAQHMPTKVAIVQEALRRTAKLSPDQVDELVKTGGQVSSQAVADNFADGCFTQWQTWFSPRCEQRFSRDKPMFGCPRCFK